MKISQLNEADFSNSSITIELLKFEIGSNSVVVSTPLIGRNENGVLSTLWLHCKQKRTCWYFKALHEYEAFVTTGQAENSPRATVDSIQLHIQRDRDHASYTHQCGRGDYCGKSDTIYHTGGACSWSVCYASATVGGITWSTTPNRID